MEGKAARERRWPPPSHAGLGKWEGANIS